MFAIGVTQSIRDGVLIETLSPAFEVANKQLYIHAATCGGAMTMCSPMMNIAVPGVRHTNKEIIVLKEMFDSLTDLEQEALMLHELAHIENGDLDEAATKLTVNCLKTQCVFEQETAADIAAVKVVGPEAMIGAIIKMEQFMIKKFLRIENAKAQAVIGFLCRSRVIRKRLKVLKALTA